MAGATVSSKFSSNNKKVWSLAFLVGLLTLLVYVPALQNDFVNWDDNHYVFQNYHIKHLDFQFFKWMFTTFYFANWHPLTWLSYGIDHAVWGLNPIGYHLTNIIFHGLNTFLVVIVIIRLMECARKVDSPLIFPEEGRRLWTTSIITGVITGLLFGVHPIHVESVAWVSERKDVLYAFFSLISILYYLKYTFSPQQKRKALYYGLCLVFFIFSLMSKPMAVTLPVVLIIFDFYPFERISFRSIFKTQRKVLAEKIPFFFLSAASSIITMMAQQKAILSFEAHPFAERLLIALRALIFYLYKIILPTGLSPLYPYPSQVSFLIPQYAITSILVVSITVFCIWLWKKQKVFLALWAYYVITLLPVLGIIQVGSQAAADRYTYLTSLSPFLLVGLASGFILKKNGVKQYASKYIKLSMLVLLVVVLSYMSILTVRQIGIWKDSLALWNHELKEFPHFSGAYTNRGCAYSEMGNYNRAIADFDKALVLNPFYKMAYHNRGLAYKELGDYQQAIEDYNIAITIDAKDGKAYYFRGNAYMALKNYKQAIEDFERAIELDKNSINAYVDRANAYEAIGNYQQAIDDYNTALLLDPKDADIYYNRGISYGKLGNYQKAIMDLSAAIRLDPQHAKAYNNRGVFYGMAGNYEQSIGDLNNAIKLQPQYIEAYYNRAHSYINIHSYQKALSDLNVVIQIAPQHRGAYKSRGNIHLILNNYKKAAKDFQAAARLGDKEAQGYLKSKGMNW